MITEDDRDFLVRFRKRVRNAGLGEDDESAIDGGPQPRGMCMPPKRASLTCEGEVVDVAPPGLDGALSDVFWAIRPSAAQLPYAMPAPPKLVSLKLDLRR